MYGYFEAYPGRVYEVLVDGGDFYMLKVGDCVFKVDKENFKKVLDK